MGEAVNEMLLRHVAAIEATLAILGGQLAALKHSAQMEAPTPIVAVPTVRIPGCEGVPDAHCARVNPDAAIKASFGNPNGQCKGCGMTLAA